MREENIKCDICGKKLGVETTPMPHEVDYWECLPIEMHHGGSLYAVATTPKEPIEICNDCFEETRARVRDAIQKRFEAVLEKEGRSQV